LASTSAGDPVLLAEPPQGFYGRYRGLPSDRSFFLLEVRIVIIELSHEPADVRGGHPAIAQ
jgi:hypothetical protein